MVRLILHRLFSSLLRNKWLVFVCVLAIISLISGSSFASEYDTYCKYSVINNKYLNAGCWSCDVVGILMSGGVGGVNVLYPALRDFGKVVLNYGAVIWIACFMLKTLGSFAAQDASKLMDGIVQFMFKWALAYVVVAGGLDVIIEWVVFPLLSIGFDIGSKFSELASIGGATDADAVSSKSLFGGLSFTTMARNAATFDFKFNQTLYDLIINVRQIALTINNAASQMQKFGDLLNCASLHGKVAEWSVEFLGITLFSMIVIAPLLWLASIVFICIGFIISIAASFYMFDIAFNLCVSIALLPLAISLWPFAWTRGKLKKVIDSIVYYVGVFMFLPLGILVANTLVVSVVQEITGSGDLEQLFQSDNSDLLGEKLGIITLGFLKVLLTYLVAFKIIPLFANEFCNHFFGSALLGNPISDEITARLQQVKKATVDRVGKYSKNVAKHQIGKSIQKMGNENGNFMQKTIAQFGKDMADTRKKK